MREIIKEGVKFDNQIFKAVCPECLCEFKFKGADFEGGDSCYLMSCDSFIVCPECGCYIDKSKCINITRDEQNTD